MVARNAPRHERGHRSHALVIVLHEHLRDPDTTSGGFVDGLLRVDGQQTHQHRHHARSVPNG